jgi:hypothetical protein
MKRNSFLRGFISLFSIFLSTSLLAYDEPAVNLGYTSFFDGGPPAGPGLYFQDYFQYYTSNRLNDNQGNRISLPQTDLDINANITQLIYISTHKILGANLGISALIPWLLQARVNDGLDNAVLRARTGSGDMFIGPALQFDPIMRASGKEPLFVQRFELDTVVPIGRYNRNDAINPGSHYWSLNPYWAATLWMTSKWSSSVRLHYLWNAKNTAPNASFGPNVRNTQAGQAVFGDFATNYSITEQFNLGINGYFFDQFTDTRANGVNVSGRRERVWAIGPGMLFGLTKNQFLFLNVYFEQDARNRAQGNNFMLRYAIHV